ncbi:YesK family protein [Bacillus sp. FSL M8-0077]|uniref:YesK family protein n=1 Tax=Bacillus sp. FSL M8-0077 TaxID=2954556 RepID=UPI00114F2FBC
MSSFWPITVILTIVILGVCFIFKRQNIPLQYGISSILILVSIILLLISFFVGSWEGLGLGAISISLLVASVITLIINAILSYFRSE